MFRNFVRALAAAEHPLVLFLDDLQWADLPSLHLLELLMCDSSLHHLLTIGAYRDNEAHDAHSLILTLKNIQNKGVVITAVTLKPLTLEHVNHLLADTLHVHLDVCAPLAKLLHRKTQGDPFFLRQFLFSLYRERLLEFDLNIGAWQGNLEMIRNADITENVVELMTGKIQQLPEETQHILKLAACIGNRFDLHTLAIVHEHSPAATMRDLWNALHEGLIVPLDDSYKYIGGERQTGKGKGQRKDGEFPSWEGQGWVTASFKFLHDRVQQVACSLIEDEHKQAVHLKIGRLLFEKTPEHKREEHIFDLVNHLNIAKDLISDQSEKTQLAELNLAAGRKAKASAAYQAAFTYLQTGIGLLDGSSWHSYYDFTLDLYIEVTEAAYLSGHIETMERLVERVLEHANTLLDKVKVYELKIQACFSQNRLGEALDIAIEVLKQLGIHLPKKPTRFHLLLSLLTTRFVLAGKRIEDLADLPEMTAPYPLAEAERARVRGKDYKAMDFYDKAIELAREHEYVNEEALANELAARFYLARGKDTLARTYMQEARYCYHKWGATAKVRHLEETYSDLLVERRDGRHLERRAPLHLSLTDTTTTTTSAGVLELATVMKAAQTLSSEIHLNSLLEKMMQIMIENAGAENGLLIEKKNDHLVIQAEGERGHVSHILRAQPVEDSTTVPLSIINYVIRSTQPLVCANASADQDYSAGGYIQRHQPKLVLCFPVMTKGEIIAIIYLENNLMTGAFTSDRVEVLHIQVHGAGRGCGECHMFFTLP